MATVHTFQEFAAISLHRADQKKFEIDFHEKEREILYNRGCAKKTVKMMKYLRDEKGGSFNKLWSHLLKVKFCYGKSISLNELKIKIMTVGSVSLFCI